MAEQALSDINHPPPIYLRMLVKFIHTECWEGVPGRCYPHIEAVELDASDLRSLEASVEGVLRKRIDTNHFESHEAGNWGYRLWFTIDWAGYGEALSLSLGHMSDEQFRVQFLLTQDRGCQDTLIVRYRYFTDSGDQGNTGVHAGALTAGGGSPDISDIGMEGTGNAIPREEFTVDASCTDVICHGDGMVVDDENQHQAGGTAAPKLRGGGCGNGSSPGNSSPILPSADATFEIPALVTPALASEDWAQPAPSPVSLVIYGGRREILAEIPLASPGQIKALHDKRSTKPFSPTRASKADSQEDSRHPNTNSPALPAASACGSDTENEAHALSRKSLGDKGQVSPKLAHDHPRTTHQLSPTVNSGIAEVDVKSDNGSSASMHNPGHLPKNEVVGAGRGRRVILNSRASPDSTITRPIVNGIKHGDSSFSSRRAPFVPGLPPTFEVLGERPSSRCSEQMI
ncbi:hypothetical protein ONZ43_g4613 [Nemania bipapillata]|uniref:Uncharacterized protein n=1 Tax=Nemania bipapillata TaxID=110536 RepID=A0ACC2IKL6_9PEZI|nr:hypothetical protein ONZ43_g4613 [Nemania bipapillata]